MASNRHNPSDSEESDQSSYTSDTESTESSYHSASESDSRTNASTLSQTTLTNTASRPEKASNKSDSNSHSESKSRSEYSRSISESGAATVKTSSQGVKSCKPTSIASIHEEEKHSSKPRSKKPLSHVITPSVSTNCPSAKAASSETDRGKLYAGVPEDELARINRRIQKLLIGLLHYHYQLPITITNY